MIHAMRMKTQAIHSMAEPIMIFDKNNHLKVFNTAAEQLLKVYPYYSLEEYVKDYELRCESEIEKKSEFIRTKRESGRTFFIHGKVLWDKKERFLGTLVMYTDITGQERLKDEAILYATKDQLTGLWNRDYFFEVAKRTIRENPDETFLMIATDIYHFKLFNEILGTEAGDDLLLAIAQSYRENCREKWVFSRISADRFALLIPQKDYEEEILVSLMRNIIERKDYVVKPHCYLGVYEITDKDISVESMYDRAFLAVESLKGNFDKEVAYYHEEILKHRIQETTTIDELDRALENGEFIIYLQPQVDIRSNEVISAEALIRWDKPGKGIVSPGQFIPIFENNGMIAKVDCYVWELACRQLAKWRDQGHEERSISVNISAKDFYLLDLYQCITDLVEKYKINPANLKLEITETAFVLDVQKQIELVERLQEYGFIIEIDDFGSGYSSLNNLKNIKADMLKMDLKFFEKTKDSERAHKIIKSIIKLSNDLGMPVIAEGVEEEADIAMIKAAGCQMVQSYYYARPLSIEAFEEFLETRPYGSMKAIIEEAKNNIK